MLNKKIRTVLIDDSTFMRRMISDILNNDPAIDLVGVANNGFEGSKMALDLNPDVVITDVVMPDYDGVYVVKSIMDKQPLPIILLSSLEKSDSRIFDALGHGAFEFIDKPTDLEKARNGEYGLVKLIREASQTDLSVLKARQLARKNTHVHTFSEVLNYEIIAIGASTGGPGVIENILNNLPANLAIPVVIAQHMPLRFLETFSQRLNDASPLEIKLGRKGEQLKKGTIYIAPGEGNMRVEKNVLTGQNMITFTDRKYVDFNYPSIDCLFESVAETFGPKSLGVILTGMGKDGVKGLLKIKEQGGYTIAQDKDSSVVFGMPKAAIEEGAAVTVLSDKQIPGFIISCL